jgi:hypothetical protein
VSVNLNRAINPHSSFDYVPYHACSVLRRSSRNGVNSVRHCVRGRVCVSQNRTRYQVSKSPNISANAIGKMKIRAKAFYVQPNLHIVE